MEHPLLLVENISFRYPQGESYAYNQISFSLNTGELMCLAGINGSGKSTLLLTLSGLYTPTSGAISLYRREKLLHADESARRCSTALVVQDANLQIMGSTVGEDIDLTIKAEATRENPKAKLEEKAHTILSFFRLGNKVHQPAHALSYGEKRKLCLATAFLREPKLLLLDEPFSGLDYPGCLEVLAYAKLLLKQGTAIIMSTHDTDLIFSIADKFLFLSPKHTPFIGTRDNAPAQYGKYSLKPLHNPSGK